MTSGGVLSTSRWTSVSQVCLFRLPFLTLVSCSDTFEINRERAIDYLNTRDNVYVFDGFAGVRILLFSLKSFLSYFLVGSQIPYQGSRYLRQSLPCPLHGTSY